MNFNHVFYDMYKGDISNWADNSINGMDSNQNTGK